METQEERDVIADLLTRLAEHIRSGKLLATNVSMENELERFYDPAKEEWRYFRIGATKLELSYHNPEDQKAQVEARQEFLEANPHAYPA